MSEEIKLSDSPVQERISELRSSIQGLDMSFSESIEGDNNLDMVTKFNEIKEDYEALLTQFEALFVSNVNATEEAVESLKETERHVADNFQMV